MPGGRETKEKPGSLHKPSPRTPAHPPGLSSQGPSALMEQLRLLFLQPRPRNRPRALMGRHLSPPESSTSLGLGPCLLPACWT